MLIPLIAFAMFAQSGSGVPQRERGATLFEACQVTVRIIDNPTTEGNSVAVATSCTSYIDGFTDGLESAPADLVCISGASMGTLARVYVAYMQKNPKLLDQYRGVGLLLALSESYPCPLKPKNK
ncbi:MAG: Rap1a/Tai family immunity protein [Edaphobacter sp.]